MDIGFCFIARSFVRVAQCALASLLMCAAALASPVTYEGYLVTDIIIAGTFYHNAEVTISFKGDTKDVRSLLQFPVQSDPMDKQFGGGAFLDQGKATIRIRAKDQRKLLRLLPHQLVVAYDSFRRGVGFGAWIGPNGFEPAYPLGLANVSLSSDPVSSLRIPGTNSGNAWSCIGYPPARTGGECSDPTPYPLKTDHGDFILFNPYTYHSAGGDISPYTGTLNRGFFSIKLGNFED
jgi:hypothetical protein